MADRLALVIANGEFDDPTLSRLSTPTRDAEALAGVLGDPDVGDFDVTLLVDEEERVVRRQIGRLYHRRSRSDLIVLYYSGHGIRDAHGDLYLATRDTEMDVASATALSASFVREHMDKSGSQRKVVILDCCHSGAFAKAGLGDSVGTGDAFAGSGYGRVILTASDALELAWEGDEWLGEGRPSVFTHFVVEGLRTGAADLDGDGRIALDELYRYVYERVLTSGHARQTPHKWEQKVEGQIVVARSPVVRPAELPTDLQRAMESSLAGVRRGAVDELDRLLRGGHPGLALAARDALQRLSDDDSRQVSTAARESLAAVDEARPSAGERAPVAPEPSLVPERRPEPPTRQPTSTSLWAQLTSSLAGPIPTWGWIVGGVVLVFLVATVFSQGFEFWPDLEPDVIPTEPVSVAVTAAAIETWTRPADGAVMVYVPAGEFQMGSTTGYEDEQPVHTVDLDGFWIDRYEVTNAQFAAFLNEKGNQEEGAARWIDRASDFCRIERIGDLYRPEGDYADHPVVEVSWHGAQAYAEWVGGRLPTEAEWEKAARGTDGRAYPWGDDPPTAELCNCRAVVAETTPVGAYSPQGDSPYGCADMAGNVMEWTASSLEDYPYDPHDGREDPENPYFTPALRGGSSVNGEFARSASRLFDFPSYPAVDYGFRVVVDRSGTAPSD